MRTPERAVWPLPPRPPVLPLPEPMPRPMRMRSLRDPGRSAIWLSFIDVDPYLSATTRTRGFTLPIMPRVAAVSGSSRVRPILLSPSPISVSRWLCSRRIALPVCWTLMVLLLAMICHSALPPDSGLPQSAVASLSTPVRRDCKVETLMLRRCATERGESCTFSASKVARTMLYGLDEPIDFATTSCIPSVSKTARIGPPAMMPVPGLAARSSTRPAPQRPSTSWCSVRPERSGTKIRSRLADSVALRIASGTSRALPWPKPTRPFWSPTTTSAAKPKRRPPFTTLATRLMWTSLSTNSLSRSSRCPCSRAMFRSNQSEIEAALAGSVGQRLHAPVVEIGAAVEHDVLQSLLQRALGDQLADRLGGVDIAARLEAFAHRFFQRRGRNQSLAFHVVDDLRIDVLRRAEHRQPLAPAGRLLDLPADARRAPLG